MKLNWGMKILIAYLLFVVGMLTLVFMSSIQSKDLVSENYYEEEIQYQTTIDQSYNTNSLSSNIEVFTVNGQIQIKFPKEFSRTKTSCRWSLYFAADKSRDLNGSFITNDGMATLKINNDMHGTYIFKLNIMNEMKEYYFEKTLVL
jgi:hypothetical protein